MIDDQMITSRGSVGGGARRWYGLGMGWLLTSRRTVDLCRLGSCLCLVS